MPGPDDEIPDELRAYLEDEIVTSGDIDRIVAASPPVGADDFVEHLRAFADALKPINQLFEQYPTTTVFIDRVESAAEVAERGPFRAWALGFAAKLLEGYGETPDEAVVDLLKAVQEGTG